MRSLTNSNYAHQLIASEANIVVEPRSSDVSSNPFRRKRK